MNMLGMLFVIALHYGLESLEELTSALFLHVSDDIADDGYDRQEKLQWFTHSWKIILCFTQFSYIPVFVFRCSRVGRY